MEGEGGEGRRGIWNGWLFPFCFSERYRCVEGLEQQVMFLELQLDLLMEYHQELVKASKKKAAGTQPNEDLCAYLNSANYIALILKKWGEQEVCEGVWGMWTCVMLCVNCVGYVRVCGDLRLCEGVCV